MRWRATEALTKINPDDPRFIPALKNMLHDKSELVATIALESLNKLGISLDEL